VPGVRMHDPVPEASQDVSLTGVAGARMACTRRRGLFANAGARDSCRRANNPEFRTGIRDSLQVSGFRAVAWTVCRILGLFGGHIGVDAHPIGRYGPPRCRWLMTPSGKVSRSLRRLRRLPVASGGREAPVAVTPSLPARPGRRASARRVATSKPWRPGCESCPGARASARTAIVDRSRAERLPLGTSS
jgi:hypothetical protein